jgi:hypothetical protein
MHADVTRFVEFEDEMLARTRFGRNRLLRVLGAGFFGAAITVFVPERALAYHCGEQPGCEKCPCPCGCCTGSPCCSCSGCDSCCGAAGNCWLECIGGRLRRVCDWHCSSGYCCCSTIVSASC